MMQFQERPGQQRLVETPGSRGIEVSPPVLIGTKGLPQSMNVRVFAGPFVFAGVVLLFANGRLLLLFLPKEKGRMSGGRR